MIYSTLIRENLKKNRGSFIGIFWLMCIITVSLCSVLAVWANSRNYVEEETVRIEYGDLIYWTYTRENTAAIVDQIEKQSEVDHVSVSDGIYCTIKLNNKEGKFVSLLPWDKEGYKYKIFDGDTIDYQNSPQALKPGEIYVPICFKSIYDAKIGDKMSLKETEYKYTIKGFYENPACGSVMMGMKDILANQEDMARLEKIAGEYIIPSNVIRVFAKEGVSPVDVQRKLTNEVSFGENIEMGYLLSSIQSFMGLLQNIFVGFMLAFVLVLLVITLVVIGHCISNTIEQSYVDFGIYKALGFTKKMLYLVQCLQYLIVLILGMLTGVILAVFAVKLINGIIVNATGLVIPAMLPWGLELTAMAGILAILLLFIGLKVRGIGKISPIQAIRGGVSDIHFDDRIHIKIFGRGLQLWVAIRQLTTGKKRYIGACFITALLVFFITFCSRLFGWLGEDGSGLMNTMGVASIDNRTYDFAVLYKDDQQQMQLEEEIRKIADINAQYDMMNIGMLLEDKSCLVNIISAPQYISMAEGRYCKYEDEIVVTNVIAKALDLEIGDKAFVKFGDVRKEFLITGINQCANDLGDNITMSMEGYYSMTSEPTRPYQVYQLKDPEKKQDVIDYINSNYYGEVQIDENGWSGVDGIVSSASSLQLLMYVISLIFIFIVVYMTGSKILFREQHDLGVYKSLGFHSGMLRCSFAIRFVIVAAIGAAIGVILNLLCTDWIAGKIFSVMGVSRFGSQIDPGNLLMASLFVVAIYFIFAYVISRKIRKNSPIQQFI